MAMDLAILLPSLRNDGCNYTAILAEVLSEKQDAQTAGDEIRANSLWAIQTVVEIHKQFVQMFEKLAAGKYYEAWCDAEQIEISLSNLARNSQEAYAVVHDLNRIIRQLQSLYPYRIFASYVMQIKKEKCSICGMDRSIRHYCGHRVGYVYNGEFCCNIVTEADFKGVDIVTNPVNKYSVLFPSDAEGQHDHYDYTLVAGLMKYWKSPFQSWQYEVKIIYKSASDFPGLSDEDYCPCGSARLYGECCKGNTEGIKHRVYTFIVDL